MTELYYNYGPNAKPPVVIPPEGDPLADSIVLANGSTVIIDGDLDIGTAGVPHAVDEPLIYLERDATLIIDGDMALYRDVEAVTPLVVVDSSSKLIVTGDTILSREGLGVAGTILCSVDSLVKFIGSTDLVAFGAGAVVGGDGSFLNLSRDSIAYFGQLLFNGGADLDMGQVASILCEYHSRLHITDVVGASDALNDPANNPGAPTCLGVMLTSGSEAFMPAYQQQTGVGSGATHANARDTKVGGAAVAFWAGAEVLTDIAAGVPELCMVHKL